MVFADSFPELQQYMVFEFENSGHHLESVEVSSHCLFDLVDLLLPTVIVVVWHLNAHFLLVTLSFSFLCIFPM